MIFSRMVNVMYEYNLPDDGHKKKIPLKLKYSSTRLHCITSQETLTETDYSNF